MWSELWRSRGVLLVGVLSVVTIWLAIAGQLVLYIHPRYIVFTVVLAALALVFCLAWPFVAARFRASRRHGHGHAHDDETAPDGHAHHDEAHEDVEDDDAPPPTRPGRVLAGTALVLSGALALAAVLLPPATLTSATAQQRDISAGTAAAASSTKVDAGASADVSARYTVLQWASLLSQTSNPAAFAGKTADVVGFVTPDPASADVFWVSRFVITCCAVDAQPVGIPVYSPNWKATLKPDAWVQVTGGFVANPSTSSSALVLRPTGVTDVPAPADPYLT